MFDNFIIIGRNVFLYLHQNSGVFKFQIVISNYIDRFTDTKIQNEKVNPAFHFSSFPSSCKIPMIHFSKLEIPANLTYPDFSF